MAELDPLAFLTAYRDQLTTPPAAGAIDARVDALRQHLEFQIDGWPGREKQKEELRADSALIVANYRRRLEQKATSGESV